jgi:mannose-1-phosphate guanylyltransferase/phosphomannomutase
MSSKITLGMVRAFGVDITYSLEDRPLGTAGSVKRAQSLLQEPFLVISGDAVTDIDLTKVCAHHQATGSIATMTLTRVPNPLEFGVAICDEAGYVRELVEKPSWGEVFLIRSIREFTYLIRRFLI